MGKKWDIDVPSVEIWKEAIRVLKPGGHLISFGGTRTYHRMAVAIEDAGFEIRDMVSWIYGSGFPKSLNIGKAVDKLQGNEREVTGEYPDNNRKVPKHQNTHAKREGNEIVTVTKGNSPWEGWGTALKPAQEPCVLARKPLSEKTVAENVLKWGTGGLNIDGCRVEVQKSDRFGGGLTSQSSSFTTAGHTIGTGFIESTQGRFPANLIHDGSDEVLEVFPETKSGSKPGQKGKSILGSENGETSQTIENAYGDSGSAARFFYCAKASKKERNRGCEGLEEKLKPGTEFRPSYKERWEESGDKGDPRARFGTMKNNHPTVKPIALMEYLIKLITPPNGTVLDPFMGSGSTGIAAKNLGHDFIGIELDPEYFKIAEKRINEA